MSASDYLVLPGLVLFPLALYALFRWRYLRAISRELYTHAVGSRRPESAQSQATRWQPLNPERQIDVTWVDAVDVAARFRPASLVEAYRHTRATHGAFAVSGAVFTLCSAVIVSIVLIDHGGQPRSSWIIGSFSTLNGLVVTLAFARLGWARSIGAVVAWTAVQLVLLVGVADLSLRPAGSLLLNTYSLNAIPILAAGLLTLRGTRILTLAFMPAIGILIVISVVFAVGLENLAYGSKGTPGASSVALGAIVAAAGIGVVVRQIRHGLDRRFGVIWLSATCVLVLVAWLTGDANWTPLAGIGVNGSLVLLWWILFSGYASYQVPDEVVHFSGCMFVLAMWNSVLMGAERFEVLWLLLPLGAFAITISTILRRRRAAMSLNAYVPLPRLLLLRVFHQRPRDGWLIDALDDSWRRVGRLDLFVGLDLALRAVNALTLRNFIFGRVHGSFFGSLADLQERLPLLPQGLSLECRYPLNELRCPPDAWAWVVALLMREARVVLMDLRGLSASNKGALQELSMVISWVPLHQVVILCDRTTDERLLNKNIQEAWSQVPAGSPNFDRLIGTIRLLRCSGSRRTDGRAVDWAVFNAAFGELALEANPLTA